MGQITAGWWNGDWWLDYWYAQDWWTEYGTATAAAYTSVETLQQALYTYLKDDTITHDQVGDRVYWVDAPQQAAFPYATYFVVSDPHEPESFGGDSAGQARVQFNIYDDNKYRSGTIAKTLRKRFHKYGTTTMAGKDIRAILCGGVQSFKVPDHELWQGTFDAMIDYYD